jgi:predicted metal-dependent HD superfamily phosphohydrolase
MTTPSNPLPQAYAHLGFEQWNQAWQALTSVPAPRLLYETLLACYGEPHRAYHTLQHLDECLGLLDAVKEHCRYPGEVALALWFHDAIYDTGRGDNEQQSADWLAREAQALGVAKAAIARMVSLVMATRHDAQPPVGDAQLLVDIDLAILGANEQRFAEYEQQVRQEYQWVPEAVFRQKRAAILQGFLARRPLYGSEVMQTRLEMAARRNLQASLAVLSAE